MCHSFGRLVEPTLEHFKYYKGSVSPETKLKQHLSEAKDFGYSVKLECKCMTEYPDNRDTHLLRPWAADEFEILTEREYSMLQRYHAETCSLVE